MSGLPDKPILQVKETKIAVWWTITSLLTADVQGKCILWALGIIPATSTCIWPITLHRFISELNHHLMMEFKQHAYLKSLSNRIGSIKLIALCKPEKAIITHWHEQEFETSNYLDIFLIISACPKSARRGMLWVPSAKGEKVCLVDPVKCGPCSVLIPPDVRFSPFDILLEVT